MATMSEAELQTILMNNPSLLKRNPGLSIGKGAEKKNKIAQVKNEKPKKYRNIKRYLYEDGFVSENKKCDDHGKCVAKFDSTKEYERWKSLMLLQEAGAISDLKRQVPFVLQEGFVYNGEKIRPIVYNADFVYKNEQTGQTIIEDVKGISKGNKHITATKDFTLKWKMMKFQHPDCVLTIV